MMSESPDQPDASEESAARGRLISQELPVFPYYAGPYVPDAIMPSHLACQCCGEARGWIYEGSFSSAGVKSEWRFCPWCIADGDAASNFVGAFNNPVWIGGNAGSLPGEAVHEVTRRTPNFAGEEQEQWWTHCRDAGRFIGEIGDIDPARLDTPGAAEFVASLWRPLGVTSGRVWQDVRWWLRSNRDRDIKVFVFECRHCGALGGYVAGGLM